MNQQEAKYLYTTIFSLVLLLMLLRTLEILHQQTIIQVGPKLIMI